MAVVTFPARNKLAYPAGRRPGFDPSHPAALNCQLAGIAANGGIMVDLLSSKVGSNATGPSTSTTSLHASMGRVTNYMANADNTAFPFVSPSGVSITLAVILKIEAGGALGAGYALNTAAAGSMEIGYGIGGGSNFSASHPSGSAVDTGVAVVFGAPYFFAASFYGPAATNTVTHWVIVRLDTGARYSGVITTTDGPVAAGDGSIWVGNRGANSRQINGSIAAAMASTAFMSQQQLVDWSKEPWGLWYPNSARSRVAAAGGFLAAWAQQTNLPVIGTGTY